MAEPPAKVAKTTTNGSTRTKSVAQLRQCRLMTAIKTPYLPDGSMDMATFDKHAGHQIQNGVQGLIVGGTTGEGHLLSWEEHLKLIAHAKERFGDRVAIVGNTGSNSTAEAVYATKKGFALGMDCSLLINPYYGKTSPQGIVLHISEAMKFGPAIVYNVPSRTGQDIKPETVFELAKHENFVGMKECMGNERIKLLSDKGVACWSGNDDEWHDGRHAHGAVGVISVAANIVPGLFKKLMEARDDALNDKLKPLYRWLFEEPNPIAVNTMLMQLGVAKSVSRLPYTVRSKAKREEAVAMLNGIGLENCLVGPDGLKVMEDSDFTLLVGGGDKDSDFH